MYPKMMNVTISSPQSVLEETKATILSQMHSMLIALCTEQVEKYYFILDNHSTYKNYTVLAYFDYQVFLSIYYDFIQFC